LGESEIAERNMAEDDARAAFGERGGSGHVAADQLRLFIERIERLEEEKK
jgi:hypothetical protein